jgi:hypothetical protein
VNAAIAQLLALDRGRGNVPKKIFARLDARLVQVRPSIYHDEKNRI